VGAVPGDLEGRLCAITGASSGIGLAAATALAARGAHLALICRDPERAEGARARIRERSGSDAVEVHLADLSSQQEIRRVAEELRAAYPSLHVLINNAGIFQLRRTTTVDGFETTFAVNHLACFLLTHLLLDRLIATPGARIVTVASDAHRFGGPLDFGDLQSERRYRPMRVYGRSKLCNILFTRELAQRLRGSGVTANCAHPGAVATRLGQQSGWWARALGRALGVFFSSPEEGARTPVYLAASPEVADKSGGYFAREREREPAAFARDDDAAHRLWEVSADLTGISDA
jgi:retinol dehydrogenase 12